MGIDKLDLRLNSSLKLHALGYIYHRQTFVVHGGRLAWDSQSLRQNDSTHSHTLWVIFRQGKSSTGYFIFATYHAPGSVWSTSWVFVDMAKRLKILTSVMLKSQSCWKKFLQERQGNEVISEQHYKQKERRNMGTNHICCRRLCQMTTDESI